MVEARQLGFAGFVLLGSAACAGRQKVAEGLAGGLAAFLATEG